jgi:prepilin-type N-terminal cleavage/methylation domain-containing protein
MQDSTLRSHNGFSLVELSIVLIILGLLTGGILGGQSLIAAAELRSIGQEYEKFNIAINAFKEKYNSIPGDMTTATRFWGRADNGSFSGDCADPEEDTGSGTQTCNGDGDGKVGLWVASTFYYEAFRFWQHLSNAGMIDGDYTGIHGSADVTHTMPRENAPASRYSGAGWTIENADYFSGNGTMFEGSYGNYANFGAPTADNSTHEKILLPEQAWNIDTKFDDGKPAKGKIKALWWDDCTLATSATNHDADYDLSNQSVACSLFFTDMF